MLIEFRVKNFKSFRDEHVFSLVASADKSLMDHTIEAKLLGSSRLVRSAVLYGANASGKSNLVAALGFVKNFVIASTERNRNTEIPVQPFRLDLASAQSPSEFEINFIFNKVRYQYSLSVDRHQVHYERLVAYPKGLPRVWFKRSAKPDSEEFDWYFGPQLKGEKHRLVSVTRPDVLFLSVAAIFNHKQLSTVYKWFLNQLLVIDMNRSGDLLEQITAERAKNNENFRKAIEFFLKPADLGVVDISSIEERVLVEQEFPSDLPNKLNPHKKIFDVQLRHYNHAPADFDISFSLEDESLGTRKLFSISSLWIEALMNGSSLIIDELDTSLHPILVRALINTFHSLKVNHQNAQLIFNTHDTTLLDSSLFRRDQIWFVEKDNTGASHLYPLLDFSPRKDESLAKGYLQGRYGAVPFIGELSPELITHVEK